MSGSKKLATKSTTKKPKKLAPAIAKPFKSAEFIQDSEEEDDGTRIIATKNYTASVKRKVQEPSPGGRKASLKSISALTRHTGEPPSSASSINDGGSESQSVSEGESEAGIPDINGSVKLQSTRPAKRPSTNNLSLNRKSSSSDAGGTETSTDDVEEISTPTPARRRKFSPPSKVRLGIAKQKASVPEISSQQNSSVQDLKNTDASQNKSDNETEDSSEGQSGSGSSESGSDEEPTPVTRKGSTYGHSATVTLRDMTKSPQCPPFNHTLRSTCWLRGCNYFVECPG